MPQSTNNTQLKASSKRKSSLHPKSPHFWNAPNNIHNTGSKSGSSKRHPYRRRSTDCSFSIYKLGENGIKNIELIEMSENPRDCERQHEYLFPPITSLRNPQLSSTPAAIPSDKRDSSRKSSFASAGSRLERKNSKIIKSFSNVSANVLQSENSCIDEFCHGLPMERFNEVGKCIGEFRESVDISIPNKFSSFGSPNGEVAIRQLKQTAIPRASSLHSQTSSEDSMKSATQRARTCRRLSLPLTPSYQCQVMPSSRDFDSILRTVDEDAGDKMKIQEIKNQKELSRQMNSTSISMKGLEVANTSPCDPSQISQEIRRQSNTRLVVAQKEQTLEIKNRSNPKVKSDISLINEDSQGSQILVVEKTSKDYKKVLTAMSGKIKPEAQDNYLNLSEEFAFVQQGDITLTGNAELSVNAGDDLIPKVEHVCTQKAELITNSSLYDGNESIIDASILNEADDDLCDTDYLEKRIIQWILSADTGCNVEQKVASTVSPSPTYGSRETAITVIHDES